MRNGLYSVNYLGIEGTGVALLAMINGNIRGIDVGGGLYNGTIGGPNGTSPPRCEVKMQVELPGGAPTVLGVVAPEGGLKFGVHTFVDPDAPSQQVDVESDYGKLSASLKRIWDLPA